MPEAATKEAALLTGEVDIAQIAAKRLQDIIPASGGTAVPMGMPWPQTIYMSGNYWSKWCPDCSEGEQDLVAMPRVGFKPDAEHPWIGDPFAPGCDYENISSLQTPPPNPYALKWRMRVWCAGQCQWRWTVRPFWTMCWAAMA